MSETGRAVEKPLIIYLHGFDQNIEIFEKQTEPFHKIEAYHLYIQAPYPNFGNVKPRGKWGFAWYLYNGKQGSFIKSLEYSSEFIQEVIDSVIPHLKISRICLVSYSMGAYLAGYFSISRWKHVNDLVVIGGRIKTEAFTKKKLAKASHINVIGIHGDKDELISAEKCKAEFIKLKESGFNAIFKKVNGSHKLTNNMCSTAISYLEKSGYGII